MNESNDDSCFLLIKYVCIEICQLFERQW